MAEKKYRVVLAGQLAESADSNQVTALLSELLHVPPERVPRLLTGRRVPLHQELAQSDAEALCARLEAAGVPASTERLAELQLEAAPEVEAPAAPSAPPEEPTPDARAGGVEIIEIEATEVGGLAQSTSRRPRPAAAPSSAPKPSPAPAPQQPAAQAEHPAAPDEDVGHEQFFDTRARPDWAGSARTAAPAAPHRGPSPVALAGAGVLALALLGGGAYLWLGGSKAPAGSLGHSHAL
jgi:hypothetical protein